MTSLTLGLTGVSVLQVATASASEPEWKGTVSTFASGASGANFQRQTTEYLVDGADSSYSSQYTDHSEHDMPPCGVMNNDGSARGEGSYATLEFGVDAKADDSGLFNAVLRGDDDHFHSGSRTYQQCVAGDNGYETRTTTTDDRPLVYPPISALGCVEMSFDVPGTIQAIRGTRSLSCSHPDGWSGVSTWTYEMKIEPCNPAIDSDAGGMGDCDEFDQGRDTLNPADDLGDVSDIDRDGALNEQDNCPSNPNANQSDIDGDGQGDVCDSDMDGDGLANDQEPAIGTSPSNPDTDGDGRRDAVDECPTDATDSCKQARRFDCASPDAQRKVFAPTYDARVKVARAPDLDLFHFEPLLVACWNGTHAAWKPGGDVFGHIDGGADEVVLEQLGFGLAYEPRAAPVLTHNDRPLPTVDVSADYNIVFSPLTLVDKLKIKGWIKKKVEPRIAKHMRKWLRRHSVRGPQFGDELRLQGRLLSDEAIAASERFRSRMETLRVPRKLANPIADWVESTIRKKAREYRQIVGAASRGNAYRKLTADKMAEELVASLFDVLDIKVKLNVWTPHHYYLLRPDGSIIEAIGDDHFVNPFLTIRRKG